MNDGVLVGRGPAYDGGVGDVAQALPTVQARWPALQAGALVTAVGELIIALLPAPLVNFGKETLGFADKPILLTLVVLGVLLLCGLAGRLEYRRQFAGFAVLAPVTVLGLSGVASQPGATLTAYAPAMAGLLATYLVLNALVGSLRRWQSGPAGDPAGRRRFLT